MNFITGLYNFLKSQASATVGAMTFLVFLVQAVFQPMSYVLPKMIDLLAITFPSVSGIVLNSFAFVDFFVPLNELAGYVAIYIPAYLLVAFIRAVKAWIPTLS